MNSKNDIECYKKPLDKQSYILVNDKDLEDDFSKLKYTIFKNISRAYVIDFRKLTTDQLYQLVKKLNTGIVLLHSKRCYTTMIYIPDYIHKLNVNGVCNLIERDLHNVIKLHEDVKKSEQQ